MIDVAAVRSCCSCCEWKEGVEMYQAPADATFLKWLFVSELIIQQIMVELQKLRLNIVPPMNW